MLVGAVSNAGCYNYTSRKGDEIPVHASTSQQGDTERTPGGAQFLIERGQWQSETMRQFEIGGIV